MSKNFTLSPLSDSFKTWLNPSKPSSLSVYGFHVTNPKAVIQGDKPILKEFGPFIYNTEVVKDSFDDAGGESLKFNDDGQTLTYRSR